MREKLNLVHLYDPNAIIAQFLKTELFNSKNIDFELDIDAKSLYKNPNFVNINFNSKIKEGLIDFDNTSFKWKNFVEFKIVDSSTTNAFGRWEPPIIECHKLRANCVSEPINEQLDSVISDDSSPDSVS